MKKMFSAVACLTLLGLSDNAMALLQLNLTDGVTTKNIADNSSNDLFGTVAGQILYTGNLGLWNFSVALATSEPTYSGKGTFLNITSFDVAYANHFNADNYLTISISDTFYGDFSRFTTNINSSLNSFASTDYIVKITDTSLNIFSYQLTGIPAGGYNIGGIIDTSIADFTGAWTIEMTTTLHGQGISSFDATTAPVPEPTTMLLFGSGLLGLAADGRRRIATKA